MKKLCLLTLAVSSLLVISSARAVDFGDIQFWAGSGTNEAAMVIDWNDGKSDESLVWGYHWDGSASGLEMFEAIVNADPRLFAHLAVYGFGTAVSGIGYDMNDNGFSVSPSLTFDSGGLLVEPSGSGDFDDSRMPTDADDHYVEGFNSGYWGYYVKSNSADAWGYASSGAADRILSDGNWDGWSFSPGFVDSDPSNPGIAPVPEPGTLTLCVLGGVFLLNQHRQNRRKIRGSTSNH